MTYQLRLRPQVESDIEETALWYDEHRRASVELLSTKSAKPSMP